MTTDTGSSLFVVVMRCDEHNPPAHLHTFTHTHTRTHSHAHTYLHTHTHARNYARTRTHARLHAHTYMYMYTHTHTHASAESPPLTPSLCLPNPLPFPPTLLPHPGHHPYLAWTVVGLGSYEHELKWCTCSSWIATTTAGDLRWLIAIRLPVRFLGT